MKTFWRSATRIQPFKSFWLAAVLVLFAGTAYPQATASSAASVASASGFHLLKKFTLGGDGGWDYLTLDSAARRLYIARATRVMVVDADQGTLIGEIPDTPGVHGVALAPALGRGFISSGRANSVTIFDLQTLKTIGQVKTGANPDAIIFDPATTRVFSFNGAGKDATVIEPTSGEVAGTISLGGKPEFAASDDAGHVYVNVEDTSELVAIDSRSLKILNRWKLAPCQEPSGLAIDKKGRRLFAGCGNKLMAVVDADSGRVITTLPIGAGVDASAYDPDAKLAFSSNGEGTLTVIRQDSGDKYSVLDNVRTQPRARTMALDSKKHNVYLVTAEFGPAPAATSENPRPRGAMVPGSFVVLVFGK